MINLNEIKNYSALSLLEKYEGINPYLKKLKFDFIKNKKSQLTENQSDYIINNHDKEPILINKIVSITPYLGEELKKQDNLSFLPEKVLIEFILAETDKNFHIYGKLKKNQKESKMYWLPKTQVIDDPYFQTYNIEVDFQKYNDVLAKNNKKLYKHQEEGVKFLLERKGSILAHDMGLGKTTTSIVAALESKAERILVVCPSSAKINWQREINVFCDDTTIIEGKKWKQAKFTIINFDILKNFHTLVDGRASKNNEETLNRELVNANFDLIIVDEAHFLKNNNSIRGKIISELSSKYKVEKVWLLTGTPIANRPMDFFNLLKIIKSPIASNWQYYAVRYCDARKVFRTMPNGSKRQFWLTDGASNLDELNQKTKNSILIKTKEEVLDMPDKIIIPMYYSLDDNSRAEYNELWYEYLTKKELKGENTENLKKDLVELILLRKFIAEKAIPYTIELVENALEVGKKVVIFTSFTDELNALAEHFGKIAVTHNGEMSIKEKQKSVDKFQNNAKTKVFIGNQKSAGVAITLTEGTVAIFNSFSWVPGDNEQAEDRCIFSGQPILTKEGYKKIEDIKLGDLVYTHLGNFKPVVDIHTHLERKKLKLDIDAFGFNEKLSVTEDHKLFIYDASKNEFIWIEAKNLDIKNHYLTLKSNKQPTEIKEFLNVFNYVSDTFKNSHSIEQKNGRLKKIIEKDGYILYPIKSLFFSKPKRGSERVYDLSVEDDHSFVVGNYNVHNCFRIGQKNDVIIYYQLFEKTISTKIWETLKYKTNVINTILNGSQENETDIIINKIIEGEI